MAKISGLRGGELVRTGFSTGGSAGASDRGARRGQEERTAPMQAQKHSPAAAPRRPRDDFDAASSPPRRHEATSLSALDNFPFDSLMELAWTEADHRLSEPRLQHVELAIAGKGATLKASFHDQKLTQWYALRLSPKAEVLWEGHELTRTSLAARWAMVANLDALGIRLPDLLDWVRQQLPQARFDFFGLQVRQQGRLVWVAQRQRGFPAEPVLEVDAESGEPRLWQYEASAGRHVLVQSPG